MPSSSRWPSRRCSLGFPTTASSSRSRGWRLGHLFPYLPKQPGYNKRMRDLARRSAGCSRTWLRTRRRSVMGCGCWTAHRCRAASRAKRRVVASWPARPGMAGVARTAATSGASGCTCCACSDGMPIAFELAAANVGERIVAAEMLARVTLDGDTVMADKGFAGAEFEQIIAGHGRPLPAPRSPRRTAPPRIAWARSANGSNRSSGPAKASSPSKRTAAARSKGLCTRVALRLLALAAGLVHNQSDR